MNLTIQKIDEALKSFFNKENMAIINEAEKRGYIRRLSHTQAEWTAAGLAKAQKELSSSGNQAFAEWLFDETNANPSPSKKTKETGNWDYPKKTAAKLADTLKKFRARTETTAYSEINVNADADRKEVVRQIDWSLFNTLIEQLKFAEKH